LLLRVEPGQATPTPAAAVATPTLAAVAAQPLKDQEADTQILKLRRLYKCKKRQPRKIMRNNAIRSKQKLMAMVMVIPMD
jgi:hypothetical protein